MTQGGSASPRRLTVLAGPTAVGKGTVAADIRHRYPEVWLSVSATTRPPRPGEVHGTHYFFVDDATFDAMVEDGELLEWAVVHGVHRYGTPRRPVEDAVAAGRPALTTSRPGCPTRGVTSATGEHGTICQCRGVD